MTLEKRQRCLTNKEVAHLAVRIFKGERQRDVAASLGISASYLSRLLKRAQKAGAFYYSVAES